MMQKREETSNQHICPTIKSDNRQITYFLFLRSTPLFLMSFFARADPGGMPYGMEESAEAEAVGIAIVVWSTGGIGCKGGAGGAEAGGVEAGSGSGLGKMCFNRLFL